jgi:hypothetical protein
MLARRPWPPTTSNLALRYFYFYFCYTISLCYLHFGDQAAAFERAFPDLSPLGSVTAWQCMYDHDA